ncbi:MAG: class I SAM-dependent methyltransferase [Rhodothermales bacterium]
MVDYREKWNQTYRMRTGDPKGPDPFLVEVLPWLRPGSVLDLACGDGRNSLYLAERGLAVTGIDVSDVGLERLRSTARNRALVISTLEADLEAPDLNPDWGPFDNVLIFNYKPSERLLASMHSLVKKGGTFVFCTFNQKNRGNFSLEFSLKPGAYRESIEHFELMHYAEPLLDGKHRDGYVFRKV